MNQQKSRNQIQRTILELRQNQKKVHALDQLSAPPLSKVTALEQSFHLKNFHSSAFSLALPKHQENKLHQKSIYKLSNILTSESLTAGKSQNLSTRKQTKSSRPVSHRKVASRQKIKRQKSSKGSPTKYDVRKSEIFGQLQILESQFFILEKNEDNIQQNIEQIKSLKAFWSKSHTFVGLFPLQYTDCIIYNHPNILPIYGEVLLNGRRYVASNQYKHSSLKDLIKQFGTFEEQLCKIYIYQILCGLQEIHKRKVAHNRLSTESILYDKEGKILINVVKCTSRPLTQKQKQSKLYQFSPQILHSKKITKSLRSDIWSIGIILLDMFYDLDRRDPKYMIFHPYNFAEQSLSSTEVIILGNLKQSYLKEFQINVNPSLENELLQKYQKLSKECKDVIKKCLVLNQDERISIKDLKAHPFFAK